MEGAGWSGPGEAPQPDDNETTWPGRRLGGSNDGCRRRGWTSEGGALRDRRTPLVARQSAQRPYGSP